ncbi:MAG: signal peptidase I [Armatimonadota bacterium]|nr:signal peptidase I [Armatimonadota bacterium]
MTPLTALDLEKRRQTALIRRVEWIVLAFFLVLALAAYACVQRVIVHGSSMEPTLHDGDGLVAWKLISRDNLRENDVIVFQDSDGSELIKRIVFVQNAQGTAVPPQLVQIPGGVRPWKTLFHDYNAAVASGRLPRPPRENTIYVMGDNTDNSEDSRVFGPIRPDQIIGQVTVKDLALQ